VDEVNAVRYRDSTDGVDWQQISRLFELVGWGSRAPEELRPAFARSSHLRIACVDDLVVGIGRSVDGGNYSALIVDLIVHPDCQGRGIGAEILSQPGEALQGYRFTTLTAAPGKENYYRQQNWKKQKTTFILPCSAKQQREHAED
jgi:GNAT superfamily N-acetyltransferase